MGHGGGGGGHGGGEHGGFGHGYGRRYGGYGYGRGGGWGWGGWWPWYVDDDIDLDDDIGYNDPWPRRRRRYSTFYGDALAGPLTDPAETSAFLAQLAAAAAAVHSPTAISSFQTAYNAAVNMGEVTGPLLAVSGNIDPLTNSVIASFTGAPSVGWDGGGPPLAHYGDVGARTSAALREVSHKRLEQVQRETAITWAYRARAAAILMRRAQAQGLHALAHHWLRDATEYAHEAVEHAALCGDGRVLSAVRSLTAGLP